MKIRTFPVLNGILLIVLTLSACIPLPISKLNEDTTDSTGYGPQINAQEEQTRIFEAMWSGVEKNYIHYKAADVDWKTIHDESISKIDNGLSSEEFTSMLNELEGKLPNGDLLYETREERIQAATSQNTAAYSGIGAFVGFAAEDVPHIVILDVISGSPAEKAGIKAHDSILAVDGEPIKLEEGLDAVERVRGEEGSKVILTIQTPGEKERDVEVTRGKISGIGELKYEILPETHTGYILFPPAVYGGMTNDVVAALDEFKKDEGLKGIILDMRISNSSSFPLDPMLSLFQNGEVGEVYNSKQSQVVTVPGNDQSGSQTIPLVVLVGENTSGLPEIFAASMEANERAVLIGSGTAGKIESLSGFILPDGSEYYIATTSFRLSGGEDIGLNGVNPKVKVEARWDQIEEGNDPVIQSAVESIESAEVTK
jgi:carboxyl-terminal processing protease